MTPAAPATFAAGRDVHGVDLLDRGLVQHTCGYLIASPRPAIVEAGPARSAAIWRQALDALGVSPAEIAYLIVTHVHLDHAGGAGVLLKQLPAATVVVHPRGARHLIDPSRLVAGAQAVFGGRVDEYFGMPEPVPESRLQRAEPGTALDLGNGHRLRFFDAPGHAPHQHMIWDDGNGCLFSADELGGSFPSLGDYVLPDAAPNQFDPEAMRRSARLALALRPQAVLLSHFGRYPGTARTLARQMDAQLRAFVEFGKGDPPAPSEDQVRRRLEDHVRGDLAARGIAWTAPVAEALDEHLTVSALGIVDYHRRRAGART